MSDREQLFFFSVIWIVLFTVTLTVTLRRQQTVGLTGAFLMTFGVNNWLVSALYVLPNPMLYPPAIVLAGLQQSVLGMAAFTLATLLITPSVIERLQVSAKDLRTAEQVKRELPPQIKTYALIGGIFFFLAQVLFRVPVLEVISRELYKCVILAACLFIYLKSRSGSSYTWLHTLAIAAIMIVAGILHTGFAGFGFVMSIFLLMFFQSCNRPNARNLLLLLLVGYIGISTFTVYFGNRGNIRGAVWGGAPLASRLDVLLDTARQFEFFSPQNSRQLAYLDIRLNRNYFVGLAVQNIETGWVDYALGQTLFNAIIAPIPRVLWPEKPVISGTSALFTKYTGIIENPTTSSGMGLLLESYINFGSVGVLSFFIVYAVLVGVFDALARRALVSGDYSSFAIWLLTGYELVDPIDHLAGVVGAMVSTFVFFKLFYNVFVPLLQRSRQQPMSSKTSYGWKG